MNDKVPVVHQYPVAIPIALDAKRTDSFGSQVPLNRIRDRLNLPRVSAATEHKLVGKRADGLNIKNDDIFSFACLRRVDRGLPIGHKVAFPICLILLFGQFSRVE